jgi:hypothetical protein
MNPDMSLFIELSIMIWFMVFNNISAISWRLVLLVEETGVPGENQRDEQHGPHHQKR